MTQIEYLSKPKITRILISIGSFFSSLFLGIYKFFRYLPKNIWRLLKKMSNPFHIIWDALKNGNWLTRSNFLIMGFSHLFRHQIIRGVLYILFEGVFIFFMIVVGAPSLAKLGTLGTAGNFEIPMGDYPVKVRNDDSFTILLYSIISILLILLAVFLWYLSIKDAKALQDNERVGKYAKDSDFAHDMVGKSYQNILLAFPMAGMVAFTIIPVIFMIIIGFTNYNANHLTPEKLFDWVGAINYGSLFAVSEGSNTLFLNTFLQVLAWTLIWAFFATFSNYFLGMIVALLINNKGIKCKKLWRTILITTIAVPQFVSLLLIQKMLNQDVGFINSMLLDMGIISSNVNWLGDPLITKVVIILVNTWIGIPYTMLICTGILMNIPNDLYESAKIDGASPFKMYMKITLPYMLFVTGPYLISQFVGNINNFNVIYLLSEGGPLFTFGGQQDLRLDSVGQTDLLITWIYKMTVTSASKDYATASVLGMMIFAIVAFLSLIFYGKSSAVKNEEDFQ